MGEAKNLVIGILDRFLGSSNSWSQVVAKSRPVSDQSPIADRRASSSLEPTINRIDANTVLLFTENTFKVNIIPIQWPGRDYNIDTLGYKVQYVNSLTKDQKIKTTTTDRMGDKCANPSGLHVFKQISVAGELRAATASLKDLFTMIETGRDSKGTAKFRMVGDRRFQMRPYLGRKSPNNILFIADRDTPQALFRDCMHSLAQYDRNLYNFVHKHALFCLEVMGVTSAALDSCQLQLIHYNPGGGILAHIDSVTVFGDTIGPIFTVNMDAKPKAFDLLPTLLPLQAHAVRLFTTHGQITMMDGESRLLWSHSIPFGNSDHCYTIAFKFPCMKEYTTDDSGGYSSVLDTYIPQNLRPELRPL